MKKTIKNLGILMLSVALVACGGDKKKTDTTTEVANKLLIKTALTQTQVIDQNQEFMATAEANIVNNIAPSNPVRIKNISVDVGHRVSKGQVLVQMDASNLTQIKLQLDNAKLDFNRIDELYKIGGVSKADWDAAKMALDMQETSYQNMLENTQLVAPTSGVVTARNYDNGDMYSGGTPVLTIEQIMPIKMLVNVSEMYYTKVKVGQETEIRFDIFGDEVFKGKISLIYPTINASSRTFAVEIQIPNGNQRVRPGMFGRVTMHFGKTEGIMVQDLSIQKQTGSNERYVYVIKDGKAERRVVTLGVQQGDKVHVVTGLEEGEAVAITGMSRLSDGAEVEIANN